MTRLYESGPDTPTSRAGRLHGLACMGIAASDTVRKIDLHKGGYTELFEAIALGASELIGDIEALETSVRTTERQSAPVAQDSASSATALVDQWNYARKGRDGILKALGPNPKDDPQELEAADELIERLAEQIAACTPRNDADAAAMLEWCVEDCAGQILHPDYAKAQQAVITYLRRKQ